MNSEPALIVGLVTAGIDLAVAFAAPINPDQAARIIAFVSAAMALIGAVVVRNKVTPA